ncbi:MAG: tRNA epoxyqueuosine(34) reductase QueG [Bacteroidales bacterium]
MEAQNLSTIIKNTAKDAGFSSCAIISSDNFGEEKSIAFQEWIDNNYHANKQYLTRNISKRFSPQKIMLQCKSVIVLTFNYFPSQKQPDNSFFIAKYAWGEDYHTLLQDKMKKITNVLQNSYPSATYKCYTDSSPLSEKNIAYHAGLGFIGKHSLLITPQFGSYIFISEILTDIILPYDNVKKIESTCGNCTLCTEACPTGAIVKPYVIDCNKCISHQTIESKDTSNTTYLHNWIYGCDICQDVCPHNKSPKPHNEIRLKPHPLLLEQTKQDWIQLTQTKFNELFKNTPVKRIGFSKMKNNIERNIL